VKLDGQVVLIQGNLSLAYFMISGFMKHITRLLVLDKKKWPWSWNEFSKKH